MTTCSLDTMSWWKWETCHIFKAAGRLGTPVPGCCVRTEVRRHTFKVPTRHLLLAAKNNHWRGFKWIRYPWAACAHAPSTRRPPRRWLWRCSPHACVRLRGKPQGSSRAQPLPASSAAGCVYAAHAKVQQKPTAAVSQSFVYPTARIVNIIIFNG